MLGAFLIIALFLRPFNSAVSVFRVFQPHSGCSSGSACLKCSERQPPGLIYVFHYSCYLFHSRVINLADLFGFSRTAFRAPLHFRQLDIRIGLDESMFYHQLSWFSPVAMLPCAISCPRFTCLQICKPVGSPFAMLQSNPNHQALRASGVWSN